MDYDEYRRHDATALAELVSKGEVSPAELLEAARARAAEVNPALNAVVRFIDEDADKRAADPGDGPFAGVPFLLKDLAQDYAGLPTSQGCRALKDRPVPEDATVTRRFLDGGLNVFGKTNTPEFGAKAQTESWLWGPARNPWDVSRTPGGSSGGSAAAVAAGVVPAAGANDGGGSIRIPASCCGLVGLKPGRGLTASGPLVSEPMHGAAVQGVVARTVRDAAALTDLLVGGEPTGPYQPAVPDESLAAQVGRDPGTLRIGVQIGTVITPEPDPEARAAVDVAVAALVALGHEVEVLDAPPYDDETMSKDFLLTWFANVAAGVTQAKALTGSGDGGFERDTLVMAALGRATSAPDYVAAVDRRHEHVRRLTTFFSSYDLLLTPTVAKVPPTVGELDLAGPLAMAADLLLRTRTAGLLSWTPIVDDMVKQNLGWVPYTQLANITGRPAISVPVHETAGGVPMGAQLVAPLGGEGLLVQVAAQLESEVPWSERRPVI